MSCFAFCVSILIEGLWRVNNAEDNKGKIFVLDLIILKSETMQGMEKVTDDFYIDRSKSLGKGNYGVVFKGYHLSENRIIAVKFMEKKML